MAGLTGFVCDMFDWIHLYDWIFVAQFSIKHRLLNPFLCSSMFTRLAAPEQTARKNQGNNKSRG